MSYVDVDSVYSGYCAEYMLNDKISGMDFWHSESSDGAWIKLRLPEPILLSAVIITRPDKNAVYNADFNRYKNVCLHLDGDADIVCTDASGSGAPFILNENEIRFPIHPPSTYNKIELKWGAGSDNYALVAQIKFEMPSDNCNRD